MSGPLEKPLAPWAIRSDTSRGRSHPEPGELLRNAFQVDRHRIITCTAFRRLEQKTQVFAPSFHDHFRTRLTHTLEAAHLARTLARALGANEDLTEAITLAHDLGHPPFGHAGEAALNVAMSKHGGFNHNAHSVRVVEYLEHPYPAFRGLNLTQETLDGLRAHTTRYDSRDAGSTQGVSVEAQIASLADRIAYDSHDLEDAVGAEMIGMEDLLEVAIWRTTYEKTVIESSDPESTSIHAIRRLVLDLVLNDILIDVVQTSRPLLAAIATPDEVMRTSSPLVAPSVPMERALNELERLLLERVYRHPDVVRMDAEGQRMILALFDAYRADSTSLPERFANRIPEQGPDRVICDYIAGMTDRFCTREYERLCRSA